jgi:hypothetical protein
MADTKITDLTEDTTPLGTDLLVTVDDPGGTPTNKKATIANVTRLKLDKAISATDKILGRATAGAGDVEEIACTAAGRALLDDADAAAQRATLGLATMWPVGSVFTSVVSTNPATLIGFGTWSAIAAGRVLIGLDSGDTDFNTVRKTGGAKTVQASAQAFTGSQVTSSLPDSTWGSDIGNGSATLDSTAHKHTVTAAGSNAPGAATSVVQPYFVVYFWERTA